MELRIMGSWEQSQNVPIYLKVSQANEDTVIVKATIKNQQMQDPETLSLGLIFVKDIQLDILLEQLFIN